MRNKVFGRKRRTVRSRSRQRSLKEAEVWQVDRKKEKDWEEMWKEKNKWEEEREKAK